MQKKIKRSFALLTLSITPLLLGKVFTQQPDKVIPDKYTNLKNPLSTDAKNLAAGAKIYKKVCWTCHGDNGKGNGPGAREIKTPVADFNNPVVAGRTDGALFWWISYGGNDMQPYKDVLSKDEIWQIIIYIRKIQNK